MFARCGCLVTLLLVAPALRAQAKTDLYGDPMPDHAVVRLGTTKFRGIGAYQASYSADGRLLVTGGWSFAAYLWDVETGRQIARFACKQPQIFFSAISPNGSRVVINEHAALRLFDARSGRELRSRPFDNPPFGRLTFLGGGRVIA